VDINGAGAASVLLGSSVGVSLVYSLAADDSMGVVSSVDVSDADPLAAEDASSGVDSSADVAGLLDASETSGAGMVFEGDEPPSPPTHEPTAHRMSRAMTIRPIHPLRASFLPGPPLRAPPPPARDAPPGPGPLPGPTSPGMRPPRPPPPPPEFTTFVL